MMSVNPGFGGQAFIEGTYRKVEKLKSMIVKAGLDTKIEIDGGVTSENARKLIDCGAAKDAINPIRDVAISR